MEIINQTDAVTERTDTPESMKQPAGLTVESLLARMDAIRGEMIGMKELCSTMEAIANQAGEDDAGHVAAATSDAFVARETTCQQQLRFLEKVYNDLFSVPSEEEKTARTRMVLDKMNDVIPCFDYSDESGGSGNVEALKILRDFYSSLLKQN